MVRICTSILLPFGERKMQQIYKINISIIYLLKKSLYLNGRVIEKRAEARTQKIHPGPPRGWQGPKYLGHLLLFSPAY